MADEHDENRIQRVAGPCYGTYDPDFEECTKQCKVSDKCKRATEIAAKGGTQEQVSSEPSDAEDMKPFDYFVQCLKRKFDIDTGEKEGLQIMELTKQGSTEGKVIVNGEAVAIEANDMKMQFNHGFKSCRHALNAFKVALT